MLTFFGMTASALISSRTPTALELVMKAGEIRVLSRNGPTTYYEGANGYTGFEYVLASAFADYLGVTLVIDEVDDLGTLISSIEREKGDFAAAGLTITDKRKRSLNFSTPYLEIRQQLIYKSGTPKPKSVADLLGKKLVIISNSSHAENLRQLQRNNPELVWEERDDVEMLDLLEMVHFGEIDFTIVDSNAYDINTSVYPKARIAFDISEAQQLAWAFPKSKDTSLLNEAHSFFESIKDKALIEDAMETFYGHLGELDYSGSILFAKRLETRLPKWKESLQAAAKEVDVDWQLLAALSYQESHWNPKAVSRTGVKGFMMLTLTTAKEMGIKNRLNPEQSIIGGAKYFKKTYDRVLKRVEDPDEARWIALAAYNVGLGHVEDARKLTEHHGGDPNKWVDVRENLLLLSKRKYYKFTKHGYARGWEAVDYVQNIRNFYNIISWAEKEREELLAQTEEMEPIYENVSSVITEAVLELSEDQADESSKTPL